MVMAFPALIYLKDNSGTRAMLPYNARKIETAADERVEEEPRSRAQKYELSFSGTA
jgi:hypothetical protein